MKFDIISEKQLCRALGNWMLDNSNSTFIPSGMTREDFCNTYPLPKPNFKLTQTWSDGNGFTVSLLRADIVLRDWQTRSGREQKTFSFYKVIKTPEHSPQTAPDETGYIII